MKKTQTYNAFTLVEILVALVIGSIAIGFAYSTFYMVNQQFNQQKETHEKLSNMYRLKSLLSLDSQKAHKVALGPQQLLLQQAERIVVYEVHKSLGALVRITADQIDTFLVAPSGFETLEMEDPFEGFSNLIYLKFGSSTIPLLVKQEQTAVKKIRARYEN